MKLKRLAALSLCACMAASFAMFATGCGRTKASDKDDDDEPAGTWMEKYLEEASEETEIEESEKTEETEASAVPEGRAEIPGGYGTFEIPEGWVLSEEHSTSSEEFYVREGDENDPPDNVSVRGGENNYAADDYESFKDAIIQQLLMQSGGQADIGGWNMYTDNGDLVIIFEMDFESGPTKQYYIVGDYEYVLVHETVWEEGTEEACDEAALAMIDTFEW